MLAVYRKGAICLVGIVAILVKKIWGIELVDPDIDRIADLLLGALTVFGVIRTPNAPILRIVTLFLLMGTSSCALTAASMSQDQAKQMLDTLKQENANGCAILVAQGTPPASRVDLKVYSAWGKAPEKCLEILTRP